MSYYKHIRLLVAGLALSLPLLVQAQKEHTWSAPVYLTVEEAAVFDRDAVIHIRLEVEEPAGVISTNIVPLKEKGVEIKEISRSGGAKDGRIDVDIIVHCAEFPELLKNTARVAQRVRLFDIQHITVDNISGVYVGNPTPPSTHARISYAMLNSSENNPPSQPSTGGTSSLTAVLPGLATIVMTPAEQPETPRMMGAASEVTIYPVPVRDGQLNIRIPESFGNVSSVAVYTLLGSLVKQTGPYNATGEPVQLSLGDLSAGVYFIRIYTQSGEIVKKVNIGK